MNDFKRTPRDAAREAAGAPMPSEDGAPASPMEIGDSDEAHSATSAALAQFLADTYDPELRTEDSRADRLPAASFAELDVPQRFDGALARVHSGPIRSSARLSFTPPVATRMPDPAPPLGVDESIVTVPAAPHDEGDDAVISRSRMAAVEVSREAVPALPQAFPTAVPTDETSLPLVVSSPWPKFFMGAGALLVATVGLSFLLGKSEDAVPTGAAASIAPSTLDLSSALDEAEVADTSPMPEPGGHSPRSPAPVPPAPSDAELASLSGWERVAATCAQRDGVEARRLFRALVGAEARSRAIVACRRHEIDVTATGEGATASELLDRAREAFDRGDYERAWVDARDSSRARRSSEALLLMGLAGCELSDRTRVDYVMGMLMPRDQESLAQYCDARGLRVDPVTVVDTASGSE